MKNYKIGDKITLEVKEVVDACKGCFFEELSEAGCSTCCAAIDCSGVIFAEEGYEPTKSAPKAIDWEQRRYEIAKGLLEHNLQAPSPHGTTKTQCAVELADGLISELKKASE